MITIIGDIHAQYKKFVQLVLAAKLRGASCVIQVGDFGWYPANLKFFDNVTLALPTYVIDGNHEDHQYLEQFKTVTEVFPNLFFVPRGTVLTLDNRRIAFMGGAASVDKAYRLRNGWHWSEGENITVEESKLFDGVKKPDIFITHCPPQSVIQEYFDPQTLVHYFDLPITWRDPNADIIENIWRSWNCPLVISGHMHRSVVNHTYRILDIDESFNM